MILSNKSPYDITPKILVLLASISEKIGAINAHTLSKVNPELRKQNRIKTIQASLQIEGNTLSLEQVTAIINHKKIWGPEKDIQEVVNAHKVYQELSSFNPQSSRDFLKAHKLFMSVLIEHPGKYRSKGVGIVNGSQVKHIAPPAKRVPELMKDLFLYLKNKDEIALIKSCVFHYELEFVHPFLDGNGRMGRLWQTLILMQEHPLFEYLPLETLIKENQETYYKTLALCDKKGTSTLFIEFMFDIIDQALAQILNSKNHTLKDTDRLDSFVEEAPAVFTRKDYMLKYKNISSATASRDLKKGVALKYFKSKGDKNKTTYVLK
jgi:Fic family protein